jgi:hypothetical protein
VDLQHILNDGDSFNHSDDEFVEGEEGIIDIGGITITNESEFLRMVLEDPIRIQVQMCQWRKLWLI